MARRIVAALDGSENSRRAAKAASELAKDYAAMLHLLDVIGSGPIPPRSPD